MTKEQWRPVVGYEGFYEVSSAGRVRSLNRRVGHINGFTRVQEGRVKSTRARAAYGYPLVNLSRGAVKRAWPVHRLVCEAFHGRRPSESHQVAHYDGNPTNNHIDNLRWATAKENTEDQIRHGTLVVGTLNGMSKLSPAAARIVRAMDRSGNYTRVEIGRMFGVTPGCVYCVCAGKTWKNIHESEWSALAATYQ